MAKANIRVYRGTSYTMTYTHPSSMSGGTVYFTVKPEVYDENATDTTGIPKKTVTSFTNANLTATWTLTDADMYIDPGVYYYDIVYEDSVKNSLPPIFTGKMTVLPHPTNRNVGNE